MRAQLMSQDFALRTAIRPKTAWGIIIADAVAKLQAGGLGEYETFKIKGVSFSNDHTGELRQDLLSTLHKSGQHSSAAGLPLLLMKEPDNPVDPEAVGIHSTVGQIGYVPRDFVGAFPHSCMPAYTDWISKPTDVPDALFGCGVTAWPALRAASIKVSPPQFSHCIDVKRWLPAHVWDDIEAAEDTTLGCCQLTGLPGMPLHPENSDSAAMHSRVFPIWSLRLYHSTLALEGFQVLSMPVIFASTLLDLDDVSQSAAEEQHSGSDELSQVGVLEEMLQQLEAEYGSREVALDIARSAGVDALRCVNAWYNAQWEQCWAEDDVQQYMHTCWQLREQCRSREMQIDVSWLVNNGFATWEDIPDAIMALQRRL